MKQTLLLTLTAFLLLLSHSDLFSQGYRPGFIVKADGDTIQGLIRYRESDRNYTSCFFKNNADASPQEYLPTDIIAYGITNDGLFESKEIIDAKQNKLIAFAEVLVHGSLSLYQYQDSYFLEKEKGELKLLTVETHDPSMGGVVGEQRTVTTSTQHLILINSLTFDCPVPEDKMAKVMKKITAPSIVAIVEAYNNCKRPNSSVTYKQDKPWVAVEKGVVIGNHTTSLNFTSGPYSMKDAKFPIGHNIIFGGHLNIMSPRKSERFSLHLEGFYSQEKYLGYLELQGPLILFKNDYDIDIKRVSVASLGRYTFTGKNKANPYIGIGMSSNVILDSRAIRRLETETTINDRKQIETTISETLLDKNFYVAITAAAGTTYRINEKHKFLFQFRYEKGNYVSGRAVEHPDLTAHLDNNNSFYLTAAYILR